MGAACITTVDAQIQSGREQDLVDGFKKMIQGPRPDGLLRSELLRGQDGAWRIQSTWRDVDALRAMRASGEPPAALALLESIGAEHSHAWFIVEEGFDT
jgi:hypothetical protein